MVDKQMHYMLGWRMVNDSCVRSMFTSLNNLIKRLCHRKTNQDTLTLIGYFPIVSINLFEFYMFDVDIANICEIGFCLSALRLLSFIQNCR